MDSQLVSFSCPKSNHPTSLLHSTIPNPHHLILVLQARSWSGTQDAKLAKIRDSDLLNEAKGSDDVCSSIQYLFALYGASL